MYKIFFWFMLGYMTHKNVRPIAFEVLVKQNERWAKEKEKADG